MDGTVCADDDRKQDMVQEAISIVYAAQDAKAKAQTAAEKAQRIMSLAIQAEQEAEELQIMAESLNRTACTVAKVTLRVVSDHEIQAELDRLQRSEHMNTLTVAKFTAMAEAASHSVSDNQDTAGQSTGRTLPLPAEGTSVQHDFNVVKDKIHDLVTQGKCRSTPIHGSSESDVPELRSSSEPTNKACSSTTVPVAVRPTPRFYTPHNTNKAIILHDEDFKESFPARIASKFAAGGASSQSICSSSCSSDSSFEERLNDYRRSETKFYVPSTDGTTHHQSDENCSDDELESLIKQYNPQFSQVLKVDKVSDTAGKKTSRKSRERSVSPLLEKQEKLLYQQSRYEKYLFQPVSSSSQSDIDQ